MAKEDCCDWDLLAQIFDDFEKDEIILFYDQPLLYTIKTPNGYYAVNWHNGNSYSRRQLFHVFDITPEMRDLLVNVEDWVHEDVEKMHNQSKEHYMLYYHYSKKSVFTVTKPFKLP